MVNYNTKKSILQNWQPFTLADAYIPRPPIKYLAGKLFEVPSLNVIFGAPGSLKSFLLADLAICVASGNDWLPPLMNGSGMAMSTQPGNVVWLDFENGKRRTHERFAALGRAQQLSENTPIFYYSMPTPWLNTRNKGQISELADLIRNHQAILTTLDNLGNISGGADENSSEMVAVFANLRWIVEETGSVLIVIHHKRKSDSKNGRAGDTLRGHSSIEAALDLALLIEREKNSSTITVQPTKVRGSDIQPFAAKFTYLHDGNGALDEARFFGVTGDGTVSQTSRWKTIYSCAGDVPLNKTTLSQKVHKALKGAYGINSICNDLDLMAQQGYLIKTSGINNAQLFTRNPNKTP